MTTNQRSNPWKIAFISLIIILVSALTLGIIWINQTFNSATNESFIPPVVKSSSGPQFTISTTKEDANYWLQQELMEEEGDYEIVIEDKIRMETNFKAFGVYVPIQMELAPRVTEEGNLELIEDSFQVGGFHLPSEQVFQLIDSNVDLPSWIQVVPGEQRFHVNLRNGVSEEVDIKVISFDLDSDDIKLEITLLEEEG
ncbi:hypothetical protein CR203_00300 [Salipaludibacillus neizhouensis]|uniref:DUF2140 domain-containing protein n=1 Tax=Salipaludibacillus neizhouensis TaxID=885475 RepID=A0A3A9K666_9BACI|nr:YpmS family protein [Salipaludibacillus neizhouensis]RKL68534.1 hypothetical protein CR203_00300 [Salipaludibacillus neizhouensis]